MTCFGVRPIPASALGEYARIPIAFEVRERLAVLEQDSGLGGLRLVVETVSPSYVKDYDADLECRPSMWEGRFDVSAWGLLAAFAGHAMVGGAAVVDGVRDRDGLTGRPDLSALWDLRVAPGHRGRGIGAALFQAAEVWAAERGSHWLRVETQNINTPACRFYAWRACTLGGIERFAYPGLPDEVRLLWYKKLSSEARGR